MRMLTIVAACLAASGCAGAVYDSLDRRGVDAKTVLMDRISDARDDAGAASDSLNLAAAALTAVDDLDGAPLARQIERTRAAGEDAALAAQDFRLSADTVNAASRRFIRDRENELGAMKTNEENRRAAEARLAAAVDAHRAFASALDAASLRLSPALSLYNAEAISLRNNPTSAAATAARSEQRAAAIAAAGQARISLAAVAPEADRFLAALN